MISIIIPVYNAAPYLRACLDSVIAQNYSCWQCVCVDDGSTDCSGEILDEFALRDCRIRVVHQDNQGVSVARNVGLDLSAGDYFTFLDADDILLPDALAAIATALGDGHYDGLCSYPLFIPFVTESELVNYSARATMVVSVPDRFNLIFGKHGIDGFVCGRVYSRSKFGHLRFQVGMKMCEDAWYWIDVIMVEARWCELDHAFVGYRQVPMSASNAFDAEFYRCVFSEVLYAIDVLKAAPRKNGDPRMKFWVKNGPVVCHHLHVMLGDWHRFSVPDRRMLFELVTRIPIEMGYNPFSPGMRLRLATLKGKAWKIVLPLAKWEYWLVGRPCARIIFRLRQIVRRYLFVRCSSKGHPRVVVNADDIGMDEPITGVILESFEKGWISQSTLMVNMPYADQAVELARKIGVADRIGFHLNLTEGRPLTDEIRNFSEVCTPEGEFQFEGVLRRCGLSCKCSRALKKALAIEVEAQVRKYVSYGLPLLHCDGHHHVQMRFPVASILIPILKKYGFKSIRRPSRSSLSPRAWRTLWRNCKFLMLAELANLKTVNQFSGWGRTRLPFPSRFKSVEIMVHPRIGGDGDIVDDVQYFPTDGPKMVEMLDWIPVRCEKVSYGAIDG